MAPFIFKGDNHRMFNPYSVRPIGSNKFEQHIQDLHVAAYYDNTIVDNDDLEKIAVYGEKIWKSEPENDPFEHLIIAMTVQAAIEYAQYYFLWKKAQKQGDLGKEVLYHSYMLAEENDFFRKYEITEKVFDKLLKILMFQQSDIKAYPNRKWIRSMIIRNYHNYKKEKGWV